jgi:hypothetical protein
VGLGESNLYCNATPLCLRQFETTGNGIKLTNSWLNTALYLERQRILTESARHGSVRSCCGYWKDFATEKNTPPLPRVSFKRSASFEFTRSQFIPYLRTSPCLLSTRVSISSTHYSSRAEDPATEFHPLNNDNQISLRAQRQNLLRNVHRNNATFLHLSLHHRPHQDMHITYRTYTQTD